LFFVKNGKHKRPVAVLGCVEDEVMLALRDEDSRKVFREAARDHFSACDGFQFRCQGVLVSLDLFRSPFLERVEQNAAKIISASRVRS